MTDSERRELRRRVAGAVHGVVWHGTEPPGHWDGARADLHREVAAALAATGLADPGGRPSLRLRCAVSAHDGAARLVEADGLADEAGVVPGWYGLAPGLADSLVDPMRRVVDEVMAAM